MAVATVHLDALDPAGNGLRVTFAKPGDRWQHAIERVTGDSSVCLLRSAEGAATDDWPASPPFQELSQETLPDGRTVLFLVGRAGTSHWSASVEASTNPPQLLFDIACRHSQSPQQLGSAYQLVAAGATINALLGSRSANTIVPAEIASRSPGTTRWKYCIE